MGGGARDHTGQIGGREVYLDGVKKWVKKWGLAVHLAPVYRTTVKGEM